MRYGVKGEGDLLFFLIVDLIKTFFCAHKKKCQAGISLYESRGVWGTDESAVCIKLRKATAPTHPSLKLFYH